MPAPPIFHKEFQVFAQYQLFLLKDGYIRLHLQKPPVAPFPRQFPCLSVPVFLFPVPSFLVHFPAFSDAPVLLSAVSSLLSPWKEKFQWQ